MLDGMRSRHRYTFVSLFLLIVLACYCCLLPFKENLQRSFSGKQKSAKETNNAVQQPERSSMKLQKVVSYSYFQMPDKQQKTKKSNHQLDWYQKGLFENAQLIPEFYGPEWTMRIYHDNSSAEVVQLLEQVAAQNPHVVLCCINNVPGLGDLSDMISTTWRFLPLIDPTVEVFHSRDLDSRPSVREINAIEEFHKSTAMFHIMRDHKQHRAVMLAGMWGAKPQKNRDLAQRIMTYIISEGRALRRIKRVEKYSDQYLLKTHLYRHLNHIALVHDSYHCNVFSLDKTVPFPSARPDEPYNFVGSLMYGNTKPMMEVCPPPCRPKEHKDWLFC